MPKIKTKIESDGTVQVTGGNAMLHFQKDIEEQPMYKM